VFYVAEACAGLRFLIASVAFGVLYAVTMFTSPWRRAAFIAVACVVPVVANGFRGLGIVLLGHALGSAQAGAADHIIYGWVFFSAVIVLLALAGLPFREEMAPAPTASFATGRVARPGTVLLACAPVVALALAAPLLAAGPALPAVAAQPDWSPAAPSGCLGGSARATGPRTDADFVCAGQHLHLATVWLPSGANPAIILDAARGPALGALGGDIDTKVWTSPGGAPWTLARAHETQRASAYAIVVDGVQGVGGLHDRLRMLRGMLGVGQRGLPHALVVTMPASGEAETVLKQFLAALGEAPAPAGQRL
jgi:exosortase/archaeosortase family protein